MTARYSSGKTTDFRVLGYVVGTPIVIFLVALVDLMGLAIMTSSFHTNPAQVSQVEYLSTVETIHLGTLLLFYIYGFGATIMIHDLVKEPDAVVLSSFLNMLVAFFVVSITQPLIIDYWVQFKEMGRFNLPDITPLLFLNFAITLFTAAMTYGLIKGISNLKPKTV